MKAKICIAIAIMLTCTSTLSILHKEPNVGAAMSTEKITLCFGSYDPNESWYGNPEGMLCDGGCYAWTFINGDVELLDSNTCPDLRGTITKVELSLIGFYIGSNRNIILQPIFYSTGEGENYVCTVPEGPPGGSPGWIDITSDDNKPTWTFNEVANLDCKVKASSGSGLFILFCSDVKIRVTYHT